MSEPHAAAPFATPTVIPALVARTSAGASDASYLHLLPTGAAEWTSDAATATVFASMREATRTAMRLPSALRAFGLPAPELSVGFAH
jgi:hypothetical protein